jgi:hypothetical protein
MAKTGVNKYIVKCEPSWPKEAIDTPVQQLQIPSAQLHGPRVALKTPVGTSPLFRSPCKIIKTHKYLEKF